jgi:hypothetical protein
MTLHGRIRTYHCDVLIRHIIVDPYPAHFTFLETKLWPRERPVHQDRVSFHACLVIILSSHSQDVVGLEGGVVNNRIALSCCHQSMDEEECGQNATHFGRVLSSHKLKRGHSWSQQED